MEPGFRTLARARPQNALETLFADEDARAAPPTATAENRHANDLDLPLFSDEWQPPKPSRHVARPTVFGASPALVALLVAVFSITPPLLLSRHPEPERTPRTVIAQHAGDVKASAPELPVTSTSEPVAAGFTRPASEPVAEPPAPVRHVQPKVTPTPVRETRRAPVANTPRTPRDPVYRPPPKLAMIPALQPAPGSIEALGTLPVSVEPPPAPAATAAPPPAAVDARPRGPSAEPVDERRDVLATLRKYEAAYSALDARAVRSVWPTVNQGALSRAFESLSSQNIRLGNCAVTVRAPTARAVCNGTATWVPRIGGGRQREDRRTWTFSLAQRDQSWSIVSAEMR